MTDVDHHAIDPEPHLAFRNADGEPDSRFVERVVSAVESGDEEQLAQLVENLHEADQATLLEALDADLRPQPH